MTTYKKFKSGDRIGYTKDGVLTKESRVPQEVKERLLWTNETAYEDRPEVPRCLFCDAPRTHTRLVQGLMVDLDDYHYYNENLGSIVAQLRLLEKEREKKINGAISKPPKRRKAKRIKSEAAQPTARG